MSEFVVALSAYECNPDLGSEAGVGWQTLLAASGLATRVVLITRPYEAQLLTGRLPGNVQVVTFEVPGFQRIPLRSGPFVRFHYLIWQLLLARCILKEHWLDDVNVAHHVTYATDWQPTGLVRAASILGIPTLLGPVGGGPTTGRSALKYYSIRGKLGWLCRKLYKAPARKYIAARDLKRADYVAALNREIARDLAALRRDDVQIVPNFVFPAAVTSPVPHGELPISSDNKLLIFAGRLHSWKGPYLAVATMRCLAAEYELAFVGSGPEEAGLRRLVERLGLTARVHFVGRLERPAFLKMLADADCLLQPSFEDSCPGVVGEAIVLGTPVVALDQGGAAELLEQDPASRGQVVSLGTRDLPRALAGAVQTVSRMPRGSASTAFSAEAFSTRLDDMYRATVAAARKQR